MRYVHMYLCMYYIYTKWKCAMYVCTYVCIILSGSVLYTYVHKYVCIVNGTHVYTEWK